MVTFSRFHVLGCANELFSSCTPLLKGRSKMYHTTTPDTLSEAFDGLSFHLF